VPGSGSDGVHAALDYLTASNRKGFGDAVPEFDVGTLDAKDKRVVVIGGGDTAMDCVRTAIRQGAKEVTCLYRRDRANMPGSQREVQNAEEEGVKFEWLASPEAILDTKGKAKGVRAARMKLGEPDASGRQSPVKTGETFNVKADMVIKALGFDPEDLPAPVRRAGPVGQSLGRGEGGLFHDGNQPAGRLRRWRYRSRRVACCLGHQGWTRRSRGHAPGHETGRTCLQSGGGVIRCQTM
jgi:NADPH-dependent glutamate synthase beta subunit-like oxidoreductase